ncbi:MAG: EamA family transporter [Acidimicrobiia bacterium]|nr:EamA family transporter [Acidimicrobiia bacterium]
MLSLAIASAISLGVADYLAGVTLRRDGRVQMVLTYTALTIAIAAVVVGAGLLVATPASFTLRDALWGVAAGVSIGLALPLLMVGFARGPIAIVAPVIGLVALAVPAAIGPLLGDQLSALEVVGLLVAFPAAALVAVSPQPSQSALPVGSALLLSITAGGLLGLTAILFGRTGIDSGIGPAVAAQASALLFLLAVAAVTGRLARPRRTAVLPAVAVGLLSAVAAICSVLAYQRGPVAIVAAVLGLAPGPTVILAWWLTQERINRLQMVGFSLGVVAVVLFALG